MIPYQYTKANLFKAFLSQFDMAPHKKPREKGKISFSKYFQEFKPNEPVAVVRELSIPFSYKRILGRTGKIIEKRGSAYYVEIKELGKAKKYLIKPIHLTRIQNAQSAGAR